MGNDEAGGQSDRSLAAERSVLGAMLVSPAAAETATRLLEERCFRPPAHRAIFHAILALRTAGEPIDCVTVTEYIKGTRQLRLVGGAAGVAELINYADEHPPIEDHIAIMREG